ncbi:PXA domain-containing protein [Gaertneriomyces semiglobifer]|nr:PXA domain-containing protein [Gaertneriomyces semiglobifer]
MGRQDGEAEPPVAAATQLETPSTVPRLRRYIPESLQGHYTRLVTHIHSLPRPVFEKLPFLLVAFLFSPRLFVYLLVLAVVAAVAYIYGAQSVEHGDEHKDAKLDEHRWDAVAGPSYDEYEGDDWERVVLTPAAEKEVNQVVTYIVRDFVRYWYDGLNHSKSDGFPSAVGKCLKHALVEVIRRVKGLQPVWVMTTIGTTLRIYLKEFRVYQDSKMDLDTFVQRNPESCLARYDTTEKVVRALRDLAMQMAVRTLPRADRSSPLVFELLNEVVATSVLMPVVEMLSDEKWICGWIVHGLSASEKPAEKGIWIKGMFAPAFQVRMSFGHSFRGSWFNILIFNVFVVVQPRNLPLPDTTGLYCTIYSGTTSRRTKKLSMDVVAWNEDFQLPLPETLSSTTSADSSGVDGIVIDLTLERLLKDEVVGSIYIPMSHLPANTKIKQYFTVDTSESRFAESQAVQVYLEVCKSVPVIEQISQAAVGASRGKEDLTAEDILVRSEGLVEFMAYMDSLHQSSLVQLYVTCDSWSRFAGMSNLCSEEDREGLRQDALDVLDTFFDRAGEMYVELDERVINECRRPLEAGEVRMESLDLVKKEVTRTVQKELEGFRRSRFWKEYLGKTEGSESEGESDVPKSVVERSVPPPPLPLRPESRSASEEGSEGENEYVDAPALVSKPDLPPRPLRPESTSSIKVESTASPSPVPRGPPSIDTLLFGDVTDAYIPSLIPTPTEAIPSDPNPESMNSVSDPQDPISSLKTRITQIDTLLQTETDIERLTELAETKLLLQSQIEELQHAAAANMERSTSNSSSSGGGGGSGPVDVHSHVGVNVTVLDIDTSAPKPDAYTVFLQMSREDGSGGWMVTKRLGEILRLQHQTGWSSLRQSALKNEVEVAKDIERFFETNIRVEAVEHFLKPESNMNVGNEREGDGFKDAQKKLMGTLKSAGGMLRRVTQPAERIVRDAGRRVGGTTSSIRNSAMSQTNGRGIGRRTSSLSELRVSEGADGGVMFVPSSPPPTPPRGPPSTEDASSTSSTSNSVVSQVPVIPAGIPGDGPDGQGGSSIRSVASEEHTTSSTEPIMAATPAPLLPPRGATTTTSKPTQALNQPQSHPLTPPSGSSAHHLISASSLPSLLTLLHTLFIDIFLPPTDFLRLRALSLLRTVYTKTYSETILEAVNGFLRDTSVEGVVKMGKDGLWKGGVWGGGNTNTNANTSTNVDNSDSNSTTTTTDTQFPTSQSSDPTTPTTQEDSVAKAHHMVLTSPYVSLIGRVAGTRNAERGCLLVLRFVGVKRVVRACVVEVVVRIGGRVFGV